MAKKNINLYLGLRFNTISIPEICKKSEKILDEIDKNNLKVKLAWNFASSPFLEDNSKESDNLIIEIKTRVNNTGDTVIPIGYSGAIHPFLTNAELTKELEWSKSNQKGSGISDIFKIKPDTLFPIIPELNRKCVFDIYKNSGYINIGIPQKQNHINPFNISDNNSINFISFIEYYRNQDSTFIKLLKKQLKQQSNDLIIMLCYRPSFFETDSEHNISLIGLINNLQNHFNLTMCSFNTLASSNKNKPSELSFYDVPGYPDLRSRGLNSIEYRQTNNYDHILNLFNPLNAIQEQTELRPLKNSFHNSRQNVSSMHGDVILAGNSFSVSFSKGRFSGIKKDNNPFSVNKVSQSYIVLSGKKYKYKLQNAFSIEGDRTRGLRSNMVLEINQNNFDFQSDFIFIEDFPYLIVTSYIKYPEIDKGYVLQQIAPIEIPLFYFNTEDTVNITGIYPDDSKIKYIINSSSDLQVIIGNAFYFQHGDTGIVFGFPMEKEPLIGTCQIKIKKEKKKYLLSINPYGSYIINDMPHFQSKKEIFSFYIGISDYCPKAIPVFPNYVLDEIPVGSVSNY